MMTRDEAAEALYRAAVELRHNTASEAHRYRGWFALNEALDAYRDSTPTPLPAEVARVVEAGVTWWRAPRGAVEPVNELRNAVDAYVAAQPDPLPARLARLRPGPDVMVESISDLMRMRWIVFGNFPERQCLCVEAAGLTPRVLPYANVIRIVGEPE